MKLPARVMQNFESFAKLRQDLYSGNYGADKNLLH